MLEADYTQGQTDLRLAFKRITDLQSAIEADLEVSDDSELDMSDDEELYSDGSDAEYDSPLVTRKGSYVRTASFGSGDAASGQHVNRR